MITLHEVMYFLLQKVIVLKTEMNWYDKTVFTCPQECPYGDVKHV